MSTPTCTDSRLQLRAEPAAVRAGRGFGWDGAEPRVQRATVEVGGGVA